MSAHTPGPWSVVYYDAGDKDEWNDCPSIQAPEDQDCAVVHWAGFKQRYWKSANGDQRQIDANARLIAAAPDLLEALKVLHARYLLIIGNEGPEALQARAAIAKATGETK